MNISRSLLTALLLAFVVTFTTACGGSDDPIVGGGGGGSFQENYRGANNLPNSQLGDLSFTVDSNNGATGTYTIRNVIPAQALPPNAYGVNGFVNPDGTFQLTGNTPNGPLEISGSLLSGMFAVRVNGNLLASNGVVQLAALGLPTPPAGTGTGTGGGTGGGNTQAINGGSITNIQFEASPDFPQENEVDASYSISGAVGEGQGGVKSATIVLSKTEINGTTPTIRLFTVSIVSPSGQDFAIGTPYSLAGDQTSDGSFATLSENVGTDTTPDKSWVAVAQGNTSGTVTIDSLNADSITMRFDIDNAVVNSEVNPNAATGSFDIQGIVTGNFVQN